MPLPSANYFATWSGDVGENSVVPLINPIPVVKLLNGTGENGGQGLLTIRATSKEAFIDMSDSCTHPECSGVNGVQAQADTVFYFRINQKRQIDKLIVSVPVLHTVSASASVDSFGLGGAAGNIGFSFAPPGEELFGDLRTVNSSTGPSSASFTVSGKELRKFVPVGEPILEVLHAYAVTSRSANEDQNCRTHLLARVDPLIEIDPSFEDADAFEIEYSSNYDPESVSGIPEPATLGYVLVAFIAMAGQAILPRRCATSPAGTQRVR
jgi:hypothetical protein